MTTSPRPTVAGLLVRPAHPYPLIGIHWPQKAAACGEGNLSTVGGGIEKGETPEDAMRRELGEEYNITDADITRLDHPCWESNGKLYTWCLVKCLTGPDPRVNREEVASFGWWVGPSALKVAVASMHASKRTMFLGALNIAGHLEPDLFAGYFQAIWAKRKAAEEIAVHA